MLLALIINYVTRLTPTCYLFLNQSCCFIWIHHINVHYEDYISCIHADWLKPSRQTTQWWVREWVHCCMIIDKTWSETQLSGFRVLKADCTLTINCQSYAISVHADPCRGTVISKCDFSILTLAVVSIRKVSALARVGIEIRYAWASILTRVWIAAIVC